MNCRCCARSNLDGRQPAELQLDDLLWMGMRQPRAAFRRMIDRGWTDALRRANPDATLYTFWDYRRERWRRDAGLRLDHLLLSPALAPRLRAAGVDRDMRGRTNASDHAPVWIELRDTC